MRPTRTVVWFRLDLRLRDNPALEAARARGGEIIPLFLWSPDEESPWPPGAASRWWLHHSLASLDQSLQKLGSRLHLRHGPALATLLNVIQSAGATAVFWNRRYEPRSIERDRAVKQHLQADGIEARSFNSALLLEPWTILNKSGKPFQVFTPYWRHCLPKVTVPSPSSEPTPITTPLLKGSAALEDLALLPRIRWDAGIAASWSPGESGADQQLARFVGEGFQGYDTRRDQPHVRGTSRLSPHLHFGEISPGRILSRVEAHARARGIADWREHRFVTELGWREFAHHLLHHFPQTDAAPLRPEFERFPWERNDAGLNAWKRGRTGYPIVDAGMRELWHTGWMHNRVRMIVASFLVKDLRIRWQDGAAWFWDTLVDADLAQNSLGWQWSAGCGADAAPYFRIFNPVTQGKTFDPDGTYVRRWIPELAHLPGTLIHTPWLAGSSPRPKSAPAGQATYPPPIVDHSEARKRALKAFQSLRS